MCALAYCAALVVYQIGGPITGEVGFNFFTIVAIVIFAAFLYLMFRPNKYVGNNEVMIDVSKITGKKHLSKFERVRTYDGISGSKLLTCRPSSWLASCLAV